MTPHGKLTRRELLTGRFRQAWDRARAAAVSSTTEAESAVAVIQGRRCLAYRNLVCTTCYERCPEEDALVIESGLPRVVSANCTGCRVCHDVCPAPENAVLMINAQDKGR